MKFKNLSPSKDDALTVGNSLCLERTYFFNHEIFRAN
jgi:hypothetical protein